MISIEDLGKRDNWLCHLCGQPVKRNAKSGSRRAPTRDHVVPRARGGTNSADNIKLAHRECNSERATRSISKFRKKVGFDDDWRAEMRRRREAREIGLKRIQGLL